MEKKLGHPTCIPELFLNSVKTFPDNQAIKYKRGHHFEKLTYRDLGTLISSSANYLREIGFQKDDRAVIISENRPEWIISELSVSFLGGISVPVHEVLSAHQLVDIIFEIEPKVIFVSGTEVFEKVKILKNKKLPTVISFENLEKGTVNFQEIIKEKKTDLTKLSPFPEPDDLASIIYTSGTTGHFKGVKLTHKNFISNIISVNEAIPIYQKDLFFSILPLSHVFERTAGYYIPFYAGACISYTCDLANISAEIRKSKPTIVIAVPRLFDKIYEKIWEKASSNFLTKFIFKLAFSIRANSRLHGLFDRLVYAKIRAQFGDNIRLFVSGGAPLSSKVGEFFEKVGFLILEGYGLTECSPVVCVNRQDDYQFGTVGKPVVDTEVKISDEGEVLVKGPGIFPGYMDERHNKQAFKDGWFKTGDLGCVNDKNRLVINGRKKELVVLSTGKKIAPIPIEEMLEASNFIDQAMVIGEGRKHITALIVPQYENLKERLGVNNRNKLINSQEARELLNAEVTKSLEILAPYQRVHKFAIIPEAFTVENGQLTPTLKLRRHIILSTYRHEIEGLYSGKNEKCN